MEQTEKTDDQARKRGRPPTERVTVYSLIRTRTGWHIVRDEITRERALKRVAGQPDLFRAKLDKLINLFMDLRTAEQRRVDP